jgi:brefeldin A-resistance guanine nucleotide exchange factor 1
MKGDNMRQKKSKRVKEPNQAPKILAKNPSKDLSHTVLKSNEPYPNETAAQKQTTDESKSENTETAIQEPQNNQEDKTFYLDVNQPSSERTKNPSESSSTSTSELNTENGQPEVTASLTSDIEEKGAESAAASVLEENNTANINIDQDRVSFTSTNENAARNNPNEQDSDYVNPRGVRFVQDGPNAANIPYGLPCLRELLRFLISLINTKNSESMITMGLNLITIGLESGVDHIASYQTLLAYIKDDLSKNLFNLLSTERLSIYASVLRVLFLLFESLRSHLKLQLEFIINKLTNIITSESNRISQEQREMTIDYLLQMLRIPGFAIEMYLNYDCSLNCSNLFEELTKLLSKVSDSLLLT